MIDTIVQVGLSETNRTASFPEAPSGIVDYEIAETGCFFGWERLH